MNHCSCITCQKAIFRLINFLIEILLLRKKYAPNPTNGFESKFVI